MSLLEHHAVVVGDLHAHTLADSQHRPLAWCRYRHDLPVADLDEGLDRAAEIADEAYRSAERAGTWRRQVNVFGANGQCRLAGARRQRQAGNALPKHADATGTIGSNFHKV